MAACIFALAAAALWLKAPTFTSTIWNVDEAIHAAVARTLLDGGVLYRDAVDQRTPLTYGAMALIFSVAGVNNILAVHVATALLIAATGLLLLLGGRRFSGTGAGIWAAGLYLILATGLFYQGDANAFVTEWFVAFFTSAAALCFWSAPPEESPRRMLPVTGALLALATLSKQPAAIDLAAPALTLAYLYRRTVPFSWASLRRGWMELALGFALPIAGVVAYYALRGALADFVYYTWTYNWYIYGPEVSSADRALSALVPFRLLAAFSPLLLMAVLLAAGEAIRRLLQRQPIPGERSTNPARLYLLVWGGSALVGAASGGRGYDHYSIPCLPL